MKKMKTMAMMLLIVMSMMVTGCISTRDTVRINRVEIGMGKDDILHLLGTPLFKNANENGEKWGYRKYVGELADSQEMYFIVKFDTNNRVTAYQSIKAPVRHYFEI